MEFGNRKDEKTVGAICLGDFVEVREIFFDEILLDETMVQGDAWILKEALKSVGGINYRLKAKRNYELLLRIAKKCRILQIPKNEWKNYQKEIEKNKKKWICLQAEEAVEEVLDDGIRTDCYLIGRYKEELISMGCFDDAVMGIASNGRGDIVRYLEHMISEESDFYEIYDCTQPILIYVGSDLCYNILDTFSRGLGEALENLGQSVEYFDFSKRKIDEIFDYIKRRLKAIIGMQTYMFSIKSQDGRFVHDRIVAPQYHFVFDHPIRVKNHLKEVPQRLCILTLDNNYVKFIDKYYGNFARFLPPAGEDTIFSDIKKRDYEVSFVGSYGEGLEDFLQDLECIDSKTLHFLYRYILNMRKNLRDTPEHTFEKTLIHYGIMYTREEFVEKFHKMRWLFFWLSNYYRNKAISTLLGAGIRVHVYGASWKNSPLRTHPMLLLHEEVIGKEALKVYARSKVTLNVMKWHKDGFTERIANAMLQKSLVATDRTTYLEKNFEDGEDILMFDLNRLEELPGRIKEILDNEEERSRIAQNGYQKALKYHTWNQRAEKILEFIEEDR